MFITYAESSDVFCQVTEIISGFEKSFAKSPSKNRKASIKLLEIMDIVNNFAFKINVTFKCFS